MRMSWIIWSWTLAVGVGCGNWEGAKSLEPSASSPDPSKAPPEASESKEPPTGSEPAQPRVEKAEVGLGKKGRSYGGGIVTEPLRARWRVGERIALLSVDQAMNLFKASEGRLPESHEEFMEKIIEANKISLPTLPDGDEYWYDADKGSLMVRHLQE